MTCYALEAVSHVQGITSAQAFVAGSVFTFIVMCISFWIAVKVERRVHRDEQRRATRRPRGGR